MNRRGFLKAFTQATIGATVAYSFPQVIVPKNIIRPEEISTETIWQFSTVTNASARPITFKMLNEAYTKACIGNMEPDFMIVNPDQLATYLDILAPQERFYKSLEDGESGPIFRKAILLARETPRKPEEISTGYLGSSFK